MWKFKGVISNFITRWKPLLVSSDDLKWVSPSKVKIGWFLKVEFSKKNTFFKGRTYCIALGKSCLVLNRAKTSQAIHYMNRK